MRRKKSDGRSPDIIVTFNFNTSSSVKSFQRFADYTNREEATEIERNAEQAFEEHFENDDYKQMISYMKRDSAIKNSDEKRTGLFNAHSQNMKVEELETLKENLAQSQLSGNNLWNGAVSFDIGYLIQIGVLEYNASLEARIALSDKNKKRLEEQDKNRVKSGGKPKNSRAIYLAKKELEGLAKQRNVDQERLKGAMQEHMGSFLKSEGFNEDAFWWGSVHLNTKHIHMHVSISELENSRKRVTNDFTGEKEPRGKFKIRNIERLKSKIFHTLDIDTNKKQRRINEIEVGTQREAILSSLDLSKVPKEYTILNFYLEEAQSKLPKTGNTSFKSNRKEFKESKAYINGFIDTYLETIGKKGFEQWKKASLEQLQGYDGTYSKDFNLEKTLRKREEVLRENIGNKILKHLKKENDEIQIQEDVRDYLSTTDYKKIVDDLKESGIPSKELGKLKYLLKISQAEDDEILFKRELSKLQNFEKLEANMKLQKFHQKRLEEKIKLSQLKQVPNFKLSSEDSEKLEKLQLKHVSARDLNTSKATHDIVNSKVEQLDVELEIVNQNRDKALLSHIYKGKSKKEILHDIRTQKEILSLKHTINKNNQEGNRQENRVLFNELKQLYGHFENQEQVKPNQNYGKTQTSKEISEVFRILKDRGNNFGRSSNGLGNKFERLSSVLSQLDFKDSNSTRARRAQKVSDEREDKER